MGNITSKGACAFKESDCFHNGHPPEHMTLISQIPSFAEVLTYDFIYLQFSENPDFDQLSSPSNYKSSLVEVNS